MTAAFRPHILIVDDTARLRAMVRAEFEGMDVTIEEAEDGIDALKKVHFRRPDLITLDVEMPRLDGHGVCRTLTQRESTFGIPIIMISALQSEAARLQALESGAVDYFVKPFPAGTLRKLAEGLFASQAENRSKRIYSIDQDPAAVARLDDMLRKHGYQHRGFTATDPLCETLRQEACDLLLLDFQLPEQGSLRIVQELRGNPLGLHSRVIATTPANGRRELMSAFNCGADDIIVKPFFLEELLARAERQFKLFKEESALRELATIDPLTRLINRGELTRRAEVEVKQALRNKQTLGVAMLDVDHFKQVNDTLGHGCGDQVLRTVAAVARESVRGTDVVGRFGGEELVILLPATTPQGVQLVLERMRRRIEKLTIASDNGNVRVTVSLGAQVWMHQQLTEMPDLAALVARADEAMYEAKRQGRNRVVLAAGSDPRDDSVEVRKAV
jgi:two-component system, cell cycle response regulator